QGSDVEITSLDKKLYQTPELDADGFDEPVSNIEDQAQFVAYFRSLVQKAAGLMDVPIDDLDNNWLAGLLSQFCSRDAFYDQLDGNLSDSEKDKMYRRYLADMLKEAMESESRPQMVRRFLDIGDQSLFTAGFFPESFMRKMGNSGLDYYLSMSRNCYRDAAALISDDILYGRVADRVIDYQQVLRCISASRDSDRTLFAAMMSQRGKVKEVVAN
ncbi:MAG: hypothetical protein V3W20_04045, partial [Candidatus Neomarinimicrobiota bacterium]